MRDDIQNAVLKTIHIGSDYHDGRGFATLTFEGDGWGQGCSFNVDKETINGLIRACGAQHLFDCVGKHCRIVRDGGPFITSIMHIVRSEWAVRIRD